MMEYTKLEALEYICSTYGGYQFAVLSEIVLSDKQIYSKHELDDIIKDMYEY